MAKVTKRTGKRRLLKLAALLETDAKDKKGCKFDLERVGQTAGGEIGLNCGTTACAMGLASISGAFKRQGLSYKVDGYQIWNMINKKVLDYDKAAMRIFGVTNVEAHNLFDPLYYPDSIRKGADAELYVANRIRKFVDGMLLRQVE